MRYSFLDVRFTYNSLKAEIDKEYQLTMDSGIYIGGSSLSNFEEKFARYCEVGYAIGVANGLEALVLALRAKSIGFGDEVIVPANTFIATWLAVAHTGAIPVPVDADPVTMNIDSKGIADAITEKTKAIIPVHLYGAPAEMDAINKLGSLHNLLILEDAAQAHGARLNGKAAGSLGEIAAFSFYPGKNLGGFGDGGAVVTNDQAIAKEIRRLSNYGALEKYQHEIIGFNSRLDPLQAALLSVKLTVLDKWNLRRKKIADLYIKQLSDVEELTLPKIIGGANSSWHLFVIRHKNRDALKHELERRGIPTFLHYPIPIHKSGAFSKQFSGRSFPVTENICETCLSLPIGPHLSTEDAMDISNVIKDSIHSIS